MIDTHCHLLPRLDDGPRDDREALQLARELIGQGVHTVVCTPHFSGMFPTVHADAVTRLEALRHLLRSSGIELETSLAAEIGPEAAAAAPIAEIRRRSVDGRFAIVEVLGDTSFPSLAAIVERLAAANLRTVLAHPERSRAVQRRPAILDPLREEGAMIQVVAPSLLGRWGRAAEAAAWRLLDTGRADLLASDAHGARRRRPHFREAGELITTRLGEPAFDELTAVKPRVLLDSVGAQ